MKKFRLLILALLIILSSNLFSQDLPKYYLQNSIEWSKNDKEYGIGFHSEFGLKIFKSNYLGLFIHLMENADSYFVQEGDKISSIQESYYYTGINFKRFLLNQRILAGAGVYHGIMSKTGSYRYTNNEELENISYELPSRAYRNTSLSISSDIALFKTKNFSNGINVQALLGEYKIYNIGYFIRF